MISPGGNRPAPGQSPRPGIAGGGSGKRINPPRGLASSLCGLVLDHCGGLLPFSFALPATRAAASATGTVQGKAG